MTQGAGALCPKLAPEVGTHRDGQRKARITGITVSATGKPNVDLKGEVAKGRGQGLDGAVDILHEVRPTIAIARQHRFTAPVAHQAEGVADHRIRAHRPPKRGR